MRTYQQLLLNVNTESTQLSLEDNLKEELFKEAV